MGNGVADAPAATILRFALAAVGALCRLPPVSWGHFASVRGVVGAMGVLPSIGLYWIGRFIVAGSLVGDQVALFTDIAAGSRRETRPRPAPRP